MRFYQVTSGEAIPPAGAEKASRLGRRNLSSHITLLLSHGLGQVASRATWLGSLRMQADGASDSCESPNGTRAFLCSCVGSELV